MAVSRYGAEQSDWAHFTLILGLEPHLLPCVSNPTAQISPTSKLKSLGKIPSLYNSDGKVVGMARWPEYRAAPADIAKWSTNTDYGICLQARAVRAFDCDITNEALAASVFALLTDLLPEGFPVRGRANSSKFLIPFKLDGKRGKTVLHLKGGNEGDKIEFLADGQQFLAAGTHDSGARYAWRGGLPYEIPTLTEDQVIEIKRRLKEAFGLGNWSDEQSVERKPLSESTGAPDEVVGFLEKAGVVLGYSPEGAPYLTCPFKAGHSKEGDQTETVYFPAGLRGYQVGHFHCLHASCAERSDDDFLRELGYLADKFDVLPELAGAEAAPKDALRFTFHPLLDIANRPRPKWLIKHILPKAELGVLFGESGAGKSFIALDIMMSIARGVEWNGRKVKQGRVAYVCAEGSGGLRNRVRAYAQHNNLPLEALADVPLITLTDTPNFMDKKEAEAVAYAIQEQGGAALIVIDTLAQTTPGANENSGEDIGKALSHCRRIAKITGAVVLLVHHAGKDLTKGARGWSGLKGACDFEMEVSRDGKSRKLRVSKEKDEEDGIEWGVELLVLNVDLDEDEAVVTSCAVHYTAPQKKKARVGDTENAVVEAFDVDGGVPVGITLVHERIKKALSYKRGGKGPRVDNIDRAIESVVQKGLLKISDGYLVSGL